MNASHESSSGRSLGEALRWVWPWLRPYRRGLVVMIVADVLSLVAQAVTPFVFARMIDGPIRHDDRDALWEYAAVLLGLAAFQTICYVLRRHPTSDSARLEQALRTDAYRRLQNLPSLYHDRHGSGQAVSRLFGDIGQIGLFHYLTVVFLVSNTLTLVLTGAMLVAIHPVMGALALVALLPLAGASTFFQHRFRGAARDSRDRTGGLATVAEESVLAVRVLRSLGGGPFATRRFGRAADGVYDAELRKIRLNAAFVAGLNAYPLLVLSLIVVGGGVAVAHTSLSLGSFVAFMTFYLRMLFPVSYMGDLLSALQETVSAIGRVAEVLDAEVAVTDPRHPVALPAAGPVSVRLENVELRYPEAAAPVLDGVSLTVEPGETVALVGATGSGKTTVAHLVGRLMDPTAGRILLGGTDLRDIPLDQVRQSVGMAFEDATLFSGTVRDNLVLGRGGITDDDLTEVLAITRADFVHRLSDGLETVVGEQGLTLSGGQRQRLALARALLGRPRVLVLDDPMSALDVRTEESIGRRLRQTLSGTTSLVIASRPATALLADRVAVLKGGRVVDVGTHTSLLEHSALYRHLLVAATPSETSLNGASHG